MVKNIKSLDKSFNARRSAQKQERRSANNTLSPNAIRQAIKGGELPVYQAVLIGSKAGGDPFTIDDIKAFDNARKATSKKWGGFRGAPLEQLIVASRKIDVQRANTEIKTARLYKVRGDLLHFNVSASGKHKETNYQVRIRLENWMEELTQTQRSWPAAIRRVLQGRLSIDCQCGRYQFWYRYVATSGGFALAPYEKDFPKIRNPKLNGCCCKHQLKTLAALKSPTVQAQLAKQMESQAEKGGFAGDNTDKFLSKEDRDQLEKARPRKVNQSAAAQLIKKQRQAVKTFKRQLKDANYVKGLEKERVKLKKQLEVKTREANKVEKSALKAELRLELDRAKMYGKSKEDAIKVFAFMNKLPLKDVEQLSKRV